MSGDSVTLVQKTLAKMLRKTAALEDAVMLICLALRETQPEIAKMLADKIAEHQHETTVELKMLSSLITGVLTDPPLHLHLLSHQLHVQDAEAAQAASSQTVDQQREGAGSKAHLRLVSIDPTHPKEPEYE